MNVSLSARLLPKTRLLYQIRNSGEGYWNRDWQPGPAPKNEKERLAAAKKYNLLPHEYEPYKPDEVIIQPGDYPKLPSESIENKDIYYPWDLPGERRNFGEPLHMHAIFFQEERCDTHAKEKYKYSPLTMFLCLAGAVGCLSILKLGDNLRIYPPVAARQMPEEGVIHYGYNK